jgi:hypothetical protein
MTISYQNSHPERISFSKELNISPQIGLQVFPELIIIGRNKSTILEPTELNYRRLGPQRESQGAIFRKKEKLTLDKWIH